jgi:hypothetical protein
MKSRIWFIAVVCLVLTGVVMARGFGVSSIPNQMIMLDDPNDVDDPNEVEDPNEPIDIPE